MEWVLGIATILELLVVGVLAFALWQDRRTSREQQIWQRELHSLTHGEDLNVVTR